MNICERINSIRNSPLCLSKAASAQTTARIVSSAFHATAPRRARLEGMQTQTLSLMLSTSVKHEGRLSGPRPAEDKSEKKH
jgi:hypothetical protein